MTFEIVDVRRSGPFDWRWPEEQEHFESATEATAQVAGRAIRVRWAKRVRLRFGAERQAGVLWIAGQPAVEAVATDDYADSGCLVSLIRRPDGRHARTLDDLPPGYDGCDIVVHTDAVAAKHSPRSLAIRAHEDDLLAWVRHGLIRKRLLNASPGISGNRSLRPSPDEPPHAAAGKTTRVRFVAADDDPGWPWRLWRAGEQLAVLEDIRPVLASWESRTNPAQIRLQAYLSELEQGLGQLPVDVDGLFLHMEIDVQQNERLLRQYDLENYLTPVVLRLGASRFRMASAIKRVGGGSRVVVGVAQPTADATPAWQSFSCRPSGPPSTTAWKHDLRDRLAATGPSELPPGPAEVNLAWQTSRRLNWVNLWKPTGDAMGPILGAVDPRRPFHLNDGRITRLFLHLDSGPEHPSAVRVGMWWQQGVAPDA